MNSMVMSIFAGVGAFLAIGLLSFLDSTLNEVAIINGSFWCYSGTCVWGAK